ncbi:MAG TPA: MerR family transcriptional regulator [Nitrospiraceae bacterium]|jgi:DNA-binding transcriptional MerR regulator|nr:MAG: hypothetical protein A2072_08010 [Nitrospirae bacterium GWC1_57_7]OGW44787.1 MAG: hypothetical protein A2X57_05165 [Nitrospirae bacterium GWD2_57_8]HAR45654.1 MerR family transcriptional regulator [Nitrospiraceae bacterium]HAS55127.1 MerR family transcriptional regulator [Nitrospiraceae bacterium]
MSSNPQPPRKLFYRIGEVSRLTALEPYVLRYWETEFPLLRPDKGKSGQRIYKENDLKNILRIKQLLYDEGYTISGAKRKLNGSKAQDVDAVIDAVKKELRDILELLK